MFDGRPAAAEPIERDDRDPIALVRVLDFLVAIADDLDGGDQRPSGGVYRLLPRWKRELAAGGLLVVPRAIGAVSRQRDVLLAQRIQVAPEVHHELHVGQVAELVAVAAGNAGFGAGKGGKVGIVEAGDPVAVLIRWDGAAVVRGRAHAAEQQRRKQHALQRRGRKPPSPTRPFDERGTPGRLNSAEPDRGRPSESRGRQPADRSACRLRRAAGGGVAGVAGVAGGGVAGVAGVAGGGWAAWASGA